MALLSFIFGDKVKARVGLVEFDASLSESHTMSATVTEHPVEEGADIADHFRRQPDGITISGIVSDTPLVYLASLQAPSPIVDDLTRAPDRADLAYAEVQRVMNDGDLVDVVTSLRTYENMALTSFSVVRDTANGNVLNATMSLRQVIVAESETVSAPEPKTPANAPAVDGGTQPTKTPPTPAADRAAAMGGG